MHLASHVCSFKKVRRSECGLNLHIRLVKVDILYPARPRYEIPLRAQLSDRNIQGKLTIDVIVELCAPPHKMGFDQCRSRVSTQHLAFGFLCRNL